MFFFLTAKSFKIKGTLFINGINITSINDCQAVNKLPINEIIFTIGTLFNKLY